MLATWMLIVIPMVVMTAMLGTTVYLDMNDGYFRQMRDVYNKLKIDRVSLLSILDIIMHEIRRMIFIISAGLYSMIAGVLIMLLILIL